MASTHHSNLNPPLAPRHGGRLMVLGVARISTEFQDAMSLKDQEALYREWLVRNFGEEIQLDMIATRAKGENLERAELTDLQEKIESRKYDLVITEDLGRIVRRLHAIIVCELCEDTETRLVAINDHVDTGQEDWKLHSFFATMRHEAYNRDTSRRVRRSHRNRFLQGGALKILLFCYRKRQDGKLDTDVEIIPELIPFVMGMIERLEEGQTYADVSDWFNREHVPLAPGSRSKKWTPQLIRYVVYNEFLKGLRIHNKKWSKRVHKTGRRVAVDAPIEERLFRDIPHLAFVDADRYDRLIKNLDERNARFSRAKIKFHDPLKGRPTKRTRWPGQQMVCKVCGRKLVFGAHGRKMNMMCSGAHRYECWNAITFDTERFVPRMAQAAFETISQLPQFDQELMQLIETEALELHAARTGGEKALGREIERVGREIKNITAAIVASGHSQSLLDALNRLEAESRSFMQQLRDLQAFPKTELKLPAIEVLREQALASFQALALDSYEFAVKLRRIVTRIVAIPVRIADGGDIALRAELHLSLENFIPLSQRTPTTLEHTKQVIVVDLFDKPQRAGYRERVMELRKCMTESAAAKELGLTVTAAQRAAKLDRIMNELGIADPYQELVQPPVELRRHLHHRYRFRPGSDIDAA